MNSDLDLRILAISPDDASIRPRLSDLLQDLAQGGVTAFMFREKSLADPSFIALGRDLRGRCDELGLTFILNERTELIEPIGARAVHLTWRSPVSARDCRGRQAAPLLIGRSVHGAEEAAQARDEGCDYLMFGPIFATPSKEGLVPVQGLERLGELVTHCELPLIAVGGLTAARVAELRGRGVAGVAAIRAFFGSQPRTAAANFRSAWEGSA